jgi:hypothetical protein
MEVMSVDGGGKRRVELHCGASMADTGGSSGVRARRKSWEEASPRSFGRWGLSRPCPARAASCPVAVSVQARRMARSNAGQRVARRMAKG